MKNRLNAIRNDVVQIQSKNTNIHETLERSLLEFSYAHSKWLKGYKELDENPGLSKMAESAGYALEDLRDELENLVDAMERMDQKIVDVYNCFTVLITALNKLNAPKVKMTEELKQELKRCKK